MIANRFRSLAAVAALAAAAALPQTLLAADTGRADFSRYVALGDSLTAGFSSGALVTNYQQNSYPALIHRQATDGAGGFEQPHVSSPGLGATPGFGILRLVSLQGPTIAPVPGNAQPLNLQLPRPYNNLAVPGADVHDLVATTTDNGGIHDLILRRLGFTQLQQGLSLQPTFVTLWIGNNDALGAATSGIVNDQTLTPLAKFEAELRAAVGAIAASGADLAIANIPDVTSIPFVTTVPRTITLPSGPFTLHGPNGPLQPGDFVLLTAAGLIQQGFGIPTAVGGRGPLPDNVVLSAAEAATIRDRINGFNSVIASLAQEHGAALVDANGFLRRVATEGLSIGGVTYSGAFLTGGLFSYDGVHPNDMGYALVANLFIEAINEHFDAAIEPVNLYPFMFGPPAFPTGAAPAFVDPQEVVLSPAAWNAIKPILSADDADQPQKKGKKPRRKRGGKH